MILNPRVKIVIVITVSTDTRAGMVRVIAGFVNRFTLGIFYSVPVHRLGDRGVVAVCGSTEKQNRSRRDLTTIYRGASC